MPTHLITSNDVQRGKPDPEPYIKAAKSLGFAPADCIVAEDAPAGIRAGKAAGCRVLALRTTAIDAELTQSGAEWIVDDLASLRLGSPAGQDQLELILADQKLAGRV
jgi:sugar-phosphatase